MKRKRVAITISMPPEIAEDYNRLAEQLAKNRSVLFREMFQSYKKQVLEQEFYRLQIYGTVLARNKGIFTEEDVEKLVFNGR